MAGFPEANVRFLVPGCGFLEPEVRFLALPPTHTAEGTCRR